jgi:polysaccharide deacetylase 2 family uncharacterized protein YibQ
MKMGWQGICGCIALMWATSLWPQEVPAIIVIIDDLGYRETDNAVFALPIEVGLSILPHTPFAQKFSRLAEQQQRDVMLHLPMEAMTHEVPLGPDALTADMYPSAIAQTLTYALQSVPNAIGVNNHMGSLLTQQKLPMTALMNEIKQHQLFFIDSRTSSDSLAQSIATAKHVPNDRRHVFIDHLHTQEFMQQQFERLIHIAKTQGTAIGIAHPHPETIVFLHQALATLHQQGVKLRPLHLHFQHPPAPQNSPMSDTLVPVE